TTVDLSGAAAASLTTSSTGYFIFSDLAAGATYSVTPSKTHYTFLPADRTYSNLGADIADSDFTCSWNYWTISGTITDSFAVLISGVTVALSGDTPAVTVTDNFGYYVFNNITAGATYTVTPSKGNLYIFNPQNAGLTDLAGDVMQDFTGSKNFAEDLENVTIYPNPWKRDWKRDIISIDNLTENVIIRIYTVSGDMVISTIPEMIAYEWDLKNDLGAPVTSGIYFCVITNDQGDKKIKKIAIIN
ncbi:carboxypeptidase regulatory-like domain-containing protein, partial [Candidatus Calescamantes bacterium]|nr:carboxypeptidase regulatory-like domain-containing protein [Candidatus Calescamantes bacterium]